MRHARGIFNQERNSVRNLWRRLMIAVRNALAQVGYPHPFPNLWNLKRYLIFSNLWQDLFFFTLTTLDESLLFVLNLAIVFLAGIFLVELFHQLALSGKLKDAIFQLLGKYISILPISVVISANTN